MVALFLEEARYRGSQHIYDNYALDLERRFLPYLDRIGVVDVPAPVVTETRGFPHNIPAWGWVVGSIGALAIFVGTLVLSNSRNSAPSGPYLSDEAVSVYAQSFVPTLSGRSFCRLLYGKNTLTQEALAKNQAAAIPWGTTGNRASDASVYARFQTDCDLAWPNP